MAEFEATPTPVETIETKTSSGVETLGQRDYRSILREENPILSRLLKQTLTGELDVAKEEDIMLEYLPFYMEDYMRHLGKMSKYFPYENTSGERLERPKLNDLNKKMKNNRAEVTAFDEIMDKFDKDLKDIQFDAEINIKNVSLFKYRITYYLNMNEWAIRLYKFLDKDEMPPRNHRLYLNCLLSFSRAIEDLERENRYGPDFMKAYTYIYSKLRKIITKRFKTDMYVNIFKNPDLIEECAWDISKPNAVELNAVQMEINREVMGSVIHDETKLIEVISPPGTGKTMNAVLLAAKLDQYYTGLIQSKTIGGKDDLPTVMKELNEELSEDFEEDDSDEEEEKEEEKTTGPKSSKKIFLKDESKYLLYICYNNLVRTEVATLCNTLEVDQLFWLATSEEFGGKIDTLIRPFFSSFSNKKKVKKDKIKEDEFRFGDIRKQWAYFQTKVKRRPAMIISDLHSAHELMRIYPDRFIPYFDEAFAGSDNDITIRILSILPKTSILLSATLPEPQNIPTIIQNFIVRNHGTSIEDNIKVIKSNKQHISCTVIAPDGCIYMPHHFIEEYSEFSSFIDNIKRDPLKIRCYSPQIVYLMAKHMMEDLPEELTFEVKFEDYGKVRHEYIRNYAMEILSFVASSGNVELFNKLKSYHPKKMENMEKNKILTSNAHYYQDGNTLHVSSSEDFEENMEMIISPIISKAPRLKGYLEKYTKDMEDNKKLIEQIKENPSKFRLKTKQDIQIRISELENKKFKIQWVPELVINSREHGAQFGKEIYNASEVLSVEVNELKQMEEKNAKLLLSGIALYQPEKMTPIELEIFKQHRNDYRFIFSTPSIVYGTNMSISIIDIDETFDKVASRNSVYQLMGRAGRRGKKSYNAMILFREWKMLRMVMNKTYVDTEAITAEELFQEIIA
jgi:hypothetical protein